MLPNDNDDDILICGKCHKNFALKDIIKFLDHKKYDCHDCVYKNFQILHCQTCSKKFDSSFQLLLHAQNAHFLKIYYEFDNLNSSSSDNSNELIDFSTKNNKTSHSKADDIEFLPNTNNNYTDFIMLDKDQLSLNFESQALSDISDEAIDVSYNSSVEKSCCSSVIPKKRTRHIETIHKDLFPHKDTQFKDYYVNNNNCLDEINDLTILNQKFVSDNSEAYNYTCTKQVTTASLKNNIPRVSILANEEYYDQARNNFMKHAHYNKHIHKEMLYEEAISDEGMTEYDNGNKKRQYPTTKPFKCEQCHESFNQRIHLRKHLSKHTGIKPFKCNLCNYSTVERSHLKVHIRIHTGEKPFKCSYCDYATAQNSTLKIHLKRHHEITSTTSRYTIRICKFCSSGFNSIEEFEKHMRLCSDNLEWMQSHLTNSNNIYQLSKNQIHSPVSKK